MKEEALTVKDQIKAIRIALEYLEGEEEEEVLSWQEISDIQSTYDILKWYGNE